MDVLATGRAELLIVPVGANVKQLTEDNVVRRTIDANLGPKPPPVVPPIVPPVTPTIPLTPFQLQLQSKLTADAATADQVTKYAAFYTVSAKQAQNTAFATVGDLDAAMKVAVKGLDLPPGSLASTAAACAAESAASLPRPAATVLDSNTRNLYTNLYNRIAGDLKAAGGIK